MAAKPLNKLKKRLRGVGWGSPVGAFQIDFGVWEAPKIAVEKACESVPRGLTADGLGVGAVVRRRWCGGAAVPSVAILAQASS